jgi:hypothetical protein
MAFLACPVLYGVVGSFVQVKEGDDKVVLFVALAAVVSFAVAFVVKHLLLNSALERDQQDRLEGRTKFPDRVAGVMIIVWLLTESIGLFGLASRFFGADVKTMAGFIGLAIVGLLMHRPPRRIEEKPFG